MLVEPTRRQCLSEWVLPRCWQSRDLQLPAAAGQKPLLMWVLKMLDCSAPQRLRERGKAAERRCWELVPVWMLLGSALLPSELRLHGFRAPADGCLPWQLQSLFPARLRGSAPCPSSSRRPARRRGGCRSGPTGPAATAACAWREVPDWPGFVARAHQGLRLEREWLQLLQLGARMLQLPVKAASGCWMCREGLPLARLLRHCLLR